MTTSARHIDNAGRYSESEVHGQAWLYDNGVDTIAVPCEEVEEFIHRAVDTIHIGRLREIAEALKTKEPAHA